MKAEVINITPALAETMLLKNTNNYRGQNQKTINKYANEMKAGSWDLNGETLKFGSNGLLLDGQHRLLAVVKSGATVAMLAVTDVKSSGDHMDRNRIRTIGQVLANHDVANATLIAAMSRIIFNERRGGWTNPSKQMDLATDSELIELALTYQNDMNLCLGLARKARSLMNLSLLGSLMYIVSDGQPFKYDLPEWFCEAVGEGTGLDKIEPAYHLRKMLLDQKLNPQSKKPAFIVRMLLTKAWNSTVAGDTMKRLKFSVTGPHKMKPIEPVKLYIGDATH